MNSQLEQLKKLTTVVADTGDFNQIQQYQPQDATTNPTLILKAVEQPQYKEIMHEAIQNNAGKSVDAIMDEILVSFGKKILDIVPGRVSTEVDARLSFDTQATIDKAEAIIDLYAKQGIDRDRVLIKIASTWEGIKAAEVLEKNGIRCNLTLLFSLAQAVACAEAKITLISPFVGRILDWHKAKEGRDFAPQEDPGVLSVKEIYNYYKKFGYTTEVMAASFRNKGEILELAGCDLLTISPALLEELKTSNEPVTQKLSPAMADGLAIDKLENTEKAFRWHLNENAMATEKTAEGIRAFGADIVKFENLIKANL